MSIFTQPLLFASLEPDAGLGFPLPLTDKYQPVRIQDFAGLAEIRKGNNIPDSSKQGVLND